MVDSQQPKKKNGKKRKNVLLKQLAASNAEKAAIEKENCSINKILPNKVGMKTTIKDVEVTMMQSSSDTPVSKKSSKKKKRELKQNSTELPQKHEDESPVNLLNFCNDGGIKLVNHPEISVTVAEKQPLKLLEGPSSKVESPKEKHEVVTENLAIGEKKKRRKHKKKKKSITENEPVNVEGKQDETDGTSPTYVKLPTEGDTCVLLVSHENFSNGHNENTKKLPNSKSAYVMNGYQKDKTEKKEPQKDILLKNSMPPIGASVNLFPIEMNKVAQTELGSSSSKQVRKSVAPNALIESQTSEKEPQTKAQLKAERRAKQEAQRAAKAAKSLEKNNPDGNVLNKSTDNKENASKTNSIHDAKATKSSVKKIEKEQPRKVRLFSHLPRFKPPEVLSNFVMQGTTIHPAVLEVGSQYLKGVVCGSNARCIALLAAFKEVIWDYAKPPEKDFSRDLELLLQTHMNFLNSCRPASVSMLNTLKFLKHQINHLPKDKSDISLKNTLCGFIEKFVEEEILLAKVAIGNSAADKIVDEDVILVFAYSSLVKDVLTKAFNQKKKFRVIVIDSRPKMEARKMLHCLIKEGIPCSYTLINAVSYVMKEVSKVIIGAHALLSNGCVMSRIGCSQIALVASSYCVPVLVCCETYKFCERSLTDSFVHNELADPKVITEVTGNNALKNWRNLSSLQLLNLLYDVTPSDFISMVITEKGALPCTSVPVVLRVRHAGLQE